MHASLARFSPDRDPCVRDTSYWTKRIENSSRINYSVCPVSGREQLLGNMTYLCTRDASDWTKRNGDSSRINYSVCPVSGKDQLLSNMTYPCARNVSDWTKEIRTSSKTHSRN